MADLNERINLYLEHFTKEELAKMLAIRDVGGFNDNEIPSFPYPGNKILNKQCKSWKDCTNPQYDCINCPLRAQYYTTTTISLNCNSSFNNEENISGYKC